MDRHNETFDAMVKRVFGPAAELDGSIGSPQQPGIIKIVLDGRTIGVGGSFQEALSDAQRALAA